MDPYTRFTRCIFLWEKSLLQFVGQDFTAENFQPSIITYSVYFLASTTYVSEIYTFRNYDTITKIFAILCFLTGTQVSIFSTSLVRRNMNIFIPQGVSKMYNAKHAEDFHVTIHLIQDLYRINAKTESPDLAKYFEKFAVFTEVLFKLIMISFSSCSVTFLLYPFYIYFLKGELMPLMPLYLPGIDETTIIGYIILNCYLFLCAMFSIIGLGALEFLLAIIIISSLIFAKLISRELQQINIDLQEDDSTMLVAKGRFKNILLMHQEMGEYAVAYFIFRIKYLVSIHFRYMRRIDRITFKTFFGQISTAFIGAILCLYGSLTVHRLYIFSFASISMLNLIYFCSTG